MRKLIIILLLVPVMANSQWREKQMGQPGLRYFTPIIRADTYFGNKDSIILRGTNGPRHMLVFDTTTGRFERMAIPSAATPNYELFFSDLSSTTVANTVTQTSLYGTGSGTAQFSNITAGSSLTLSGSGTLSTDATPGVPELSFTIGTYTLGMNLTGLTGGLINVPFEYKYEIVPLATGASQDIFVNCVIRVYIDVDNYKMYTFSQLVSASFTTTGTPSANVQVEWDTADADNSITGLINKVEIHRK